MADIKIKGTFLGQPIDLMICESESVPEQPSKPEGVFTPSEDEVAKQAKNAAQAPAPPLDATAEGEVVTSLADPAPEAAEPSDEPKNPAGNAEQV